MSKIDYFNVKIPKDKEPKEYTYAQRRAELLEKIFEKGHPGLVNQTKMAKKYGVEQPTISRDLDAINECVSDKLNRRADLLFSSLYESTIKELKDEGESGELRHWIREFKEFLQERGEMKKEPEKHEIEHSGEVSIGEEIKKARKALEEKNG